MDISTQSWEGGFNYSKDDIVKIDDLTQLNYGDSAAGQVVSDAEAVNPVLAPLSIADSADPVIIGEATLTSIGSFTQLTSLIDSDGFEIRQSDLNELVENYSDIPLSQLDLTYHSIKQIITPNSFTFDDSSSRGTSVTATPDFSLNVETMDNDIFTRQITDSSF